MKLAIINLAPSVALLVTCYEGVTMKVANFLFLDVLSEEKY
jgi:hypothetical protein